MQVLTNQEFTYRQTPATEEGTGTFDSIKGNTLVWNQLVQNGNFASTSGWTNGGGTSFTASNNEVTFVGNQYTNFLQAMPRSCIGHKILAMATCKTNGTYSLFKIRKYTSSSAYTDTNADIPTSYQTLHQLITLDSNLTGITLMFQNNANASATINAKNIMLFDLTAMGLDVTADQFRALFPLPYYAYNSGSLLSFNGTGLKTTGKNLLNVRATLTNNGITFTNDNGVISLNGTATANAYFTTNIGLRNGSYYIGAFNEEISNYVHVAVRNKSGAYPLDVTMSSKNRATSLNNDIDDFIIWVNSGTTLNNFVLKPMVSLETPTSYEPYTVNATGLPISTYFLTGMKSAGNVYDELTPSKVIARVGAVDLGTMTFTNPSNGGGSTATWTQGDILSDAKYSTDPAVAINGTCIYKMETANDVYIGNVDNAICMNQSGRVQIRSSAFLNKTGAEIKTLLSGVYLNYELATPIEQTITPKLDLTFGISNGGTEEIMPPNLRTPYTSPILADITYRGLIPVSVVSYPSDAGETTGSGLYRYLETVTITATPKDEVYRFLRFEDENGSTLSTESTYTFKVGD